MTLHNYFHTSIFFSKGVMARVMLFSSRDATSLLHCKNAAFSFNYISRALIEGFHNGLLGSFNGVYLGALRELSDRKVFKSSYYTMALS